MSFQGSPQYAIFQPRENPCRHVPAPLSAAARKEVCEVQVRRETQLPTAVVCPPSCKKHLAVLLGAYGYQ